MAKTGLMHPTYAPISAEPANAPIVYGKGEIFAHAISAQVSFQRNDEPLYGDDTTVENDNSVTGAEVTVGVDDVPEETQVGLLGVEKETAGGASDPEYHDTSASAPYVGFGYLQVRKRDGVISYIGNWFHKVQFSAGDESTQTKGQKIEWQTDTIKGTAVGVKVDASGKTRFRVRVPFKTYDAALAWLKGKANITETIPSEG